MKWTVIIIGLTIGLNLAITQRTEAQSNRTFVSGEGADSGGCTRAVPCRSFAYALTQTAAAGEITVLDSAGYGPVTITGSLTITNPGGVEAGVTAVSGVTAITINTSEGANITLRGLTLDGGGVGGNGISLMSTLPPAGAPINLSILGCVIKDFAGDGINITPASSQPNSGVLVNAQIADSFVLNNATDGVALTYIGYLTVDGSIERTTVSGNGSGIDVTGVNVRAILFNDEIDNNVNDALVINNGTVIMKNSVAYWSGTNDITVSGGPDTSFLMLYNNNTIGSVMNSGSAYTDGTNNILDLSGNASSKLNTQ